MILNLCQKLILSYDVTYNSSAAEIFPNSTIVLFIIVLMSSLFFLHLNCWIIDQCLWFESLASIDGGQHNLILPLTCAGASKNTDPTYCIA